VKVSLEASWREERQSAWLYRRLAESEPEPEKQKLFIALAETAEVQAGIWASQIRDGGREVPEFHPSLRARAVAALAARLGPRRIRPVLSAMKVRGMSIYNGLLAEDQEHRMPKTMADVGRHHPGVGTGGNLRAAVFGVNDGLVSNTSLIMGVAGATADPTFILMSGIAGLLAGALSMAAGEYISVRSQREFFEYQIGLEREEVRQYPGEETEELAIIFNARGLPMGQAREMARSIMKDPEKALVTMAREELGLNPDDLGSPLGAAVSSFAAFTGGALIPLLPFFFGAGNLAVPVAAILAAIGLFAVGALLSLFTGWGAWRSGLRMVAIGGTAGLATYLIGTLLGVSLT
jgi:VIT1/CCC1 family predicted Fe2+/Mn2+ transporter